MYTIVTAFFHVGREAWKGFERPVDYYLERAIRVFSLDDYMVIYIQPELVDFVKAHRAKHENKTKIIPFTVEQLHYYKYKNEIEKIMQDPEFRKGLVTPDRPEVAQPIYDVIMWSKISLVTRTIEENPFHTSHFVWLDFGISPRVLKDDMINKPLLAQIPDKIKLLCMRYPSPAELDIHKFFKSHTNRFAGTMVTGSAENFKIFQQYLDEEIRYCLSQNAVDNDQSLFCLVFLKHPELFELYYGYWGELISNYYEITKNLAAVMHIAFTAKEEGRLDIYEDILKRITKYSPKLWEY